MRLQARDASRSWPLEAAERAAPWGRHGDGPRAPGQESRRARPHDRRTAPLRSRRRRAPNRCHDEAPAEPGEPAARAHSSWFCRRSDCAHAAPVTGSDGNFSLEYRRVVEMGGIEPPSDGGATGLLRVQFAHDFLSPGVSREQGRRRAQSSRCSGIPDDGGSQQWLPG